MKNILLISIAMILLSSALFAQDDAKIDTVLENQNRMMQNQAKILNEVTYVDPLAGKHFGIEFNPALLLAGLGNNEVYLSGGFSLFNVAPQAEIAFPIYYRNDNSQL